MGLLARMKDLGASEQENRGFSLCLPLHRIVSHSWGDKGLEKQWILKLHLGAYPSTPLVNLLLPTSPPRAFSTLLPTTAGFHWTTVSGAYLHIASHQFIVQASCAMPQVLYPRCLQVEVWLFRGYSMQQGNPGKWWCLLARSEQHHLVNLLQREERTHYPTTWHLQAKACSTEASIDMLKSLHFSIILWRK